MRTLQTADLMFPKTPKIALDVLKNFLAGELQQTSPRNALQDLFPNIDFENLNTEEDQSFGQDPYALMERNCLEIRQRVKACPSLRLRCNTFVVVENIWGQTLAVWKTN